ncbi:hypothetical protein VB735_21695 [Halotia wernerae UHCC 0503]|nr:hypothetical protein [Halotia wernerae UHCC 0503]
MLEKITGQSYEDLLRDRVFLPLGMNAPVILPALLMIILL